MGSERRQVVGGIGASAGHDLFFTLLENQYGRLPRDAHDFAIHGFVRDQVTEHDDALAREALHQRQ